MYAGKSFLVCCAVVGFLALIVTSGCASTPKPVPRIQVSAHDYAADFDSVWSAVNDVLTEKRLPIKTIEKDSGLIATDTVSAGGRYVFYGKTEDGQELSQWADKTRYFLNIRVREIEGGVQVDVIPHMEFMRYQYDSRLGRSVEVGWEPVDSHGDIEKEIYDALDAKLAG